MEISGAYNAITNLMDLVGKESEEVEAGKSKSGKNSKSTKSSEEASGDIAYFSETSLSLRNVSTNLSSGVGVLDSLESNEAKLREHFLGALGAKLEEAGVDTSKHITLKREKDGSVVVANDHPDKELIESVFKEVPVLKDAFNAMAEQSELARKIKSDRSVSFARMGGLSAYMNSLGSTAGDDQSFFMSLADGVSSSYFSSEYWMAK